MQNNSDQMDVLVIGRNCLDYISVVETFPAEDQKVPLDFRLVEGGGQGGGLRPAVLPGSRAGLV